MRDPHFWSWLRQHWRRAIAMVSPLLVPPVFKVLERIRPALVEGLLPYAGVLPMALNAVALLVLLMFLGRPPAVDEQRYAAASRQVRQFGSWWHAMWFIWFLQYLALALLNWPFEGKGRDAMSRMRGDAEVPAAAYFWADAAITALSLGTCACLVVCYLVLANRRATGAELAGKVGPIFVVLLTPLVVLAATASSDGLSAHAYALSLIWGTTFYGALFCVSACVLVGRLESRVIAPPLPVIVLLYAYGALLLAATVFEGAQGLPGLNREIRQVAADTWRALLLMAVFLKALLFLFVYWLLHSGVLLFYMQWMLQAGGGGGNDIDQQRQKFVRALGYADVPTPRASPIPPLDD